MRRTKGRTDVRHLRLRSTWEQRQRANRAILHPSTSCSQRSVWAHVCECYGNVKLTGCVLWMWQDHTGNRAQINGWLDVWTDRRRDRGISSRKSQRLSNLTRQKCLCFSFIVKMPSTPDKKKCLYCGIQAHLTTKMKLIGCGIQCNPKTDWKRFLLEVGEMGERDFIVAAVQH